MRRASKRIVAVVVVAAFVTACILIVGSEGFAFDTLAANGTLTPWAYLPFIARQPTPTPTPIPCLTVPTLIGPVDGSNLNTRIPLFTVDCGSNPNATGLVIELHSGDAPKVTGLAHIGCTQGICKWRQDCNLHAAVTYHWYAYLMCGKTQGPRSEEWSFTTGSGGPILLAPNPLSPADGSTLPSTTATLKWSSVSGAVEYQVFVYCLPSHRPHLYKTVQCGCGPGTCRVVEGTKSTFYGLMENAVCFWSVTGRNDYAWGESASRCFTTGSDGAQISLGSSSPSLQDSQNHALGQWGR